MGNIRLKHHLKQTIKFPFEIFASTFGLHRRKPKKEQLWIITYHRILPKADPRYFLEEPGMIVEPATLRNHLKLLKNEFTIVDLEDWVSRREKKQTLPKKACAITFDDGWLDNYEHAFPILKEENVPATIFAVSNMIGRNDLFWPNRVQRILQEPKSKLKSFNWLWQLFEEDLTDNERSARVIYSLKQKSDIELLRLIEEAESELKIPPPSQPSLVNENQLKEMANSGYVKIGSHTCHHIRLSNSLDSKTLETEIVESKKRLEFITGKSINLFCYPNGDYCDAAVELVAKHYDAAVTTHSGINVAPSCNLFTLARFSIHQDISKNKRQFLSLISGWWC